MRWFRWTWRRTGAALLVALAAGMALLGSQGDMGGHALRAHAQSTPANDAFANPAIVGPGFSPPGAGNPLPWDGAQSTEGATLEAGETAPCGPTGATVWYVLQTGTTGNVEVTADGSDFDTILAVYTTGDGFLPSPPGANLNNVACNDDTAGVTSSLSFTMSRGSQYYIQVGGKQGATGNLRLHFACNPECPPPNDDFFTPGYLYVDAFTTTQTARAATVAATVQSGEQSPCGNIGKTVWYQIQVNQDSTVRFDTDGSDFDTAIALYAYPPPAGGSYDPRPQSIQRIGCAASGRQRASLTSRLSTGIAYWIQAGGKDGASGNLSLAASCDPACPPYNDSFQSPDSFTGNVLTGVPTGGATVEAGEPQACGSLSHTVWYSLYVFGDTNLVVDTTGSDYPTALALYEVSTPTYPLTFDQLSLIACGENSGEASRLSFKAHPRHTYLLQVGGRNDASGTLQLSVACDPEVCPPDNDGAAAPYATNVPGSFPFSSVVDTRGATVEPGEPSDCGHMGKTVWYWVISASDASMRFDTDGSDFATAIAVYAADFPFSPPGGASQRIACATSDATGRAHVDFPLKAGQGLFVQVGGMDGAGGMLQLHSDCSAGCPPANDNFNQAFELGFGSLSDSPNLGGATLEAGEPHDCGNVDATVWYRYFTSGPTSFTVDFADSEVLPAIAVYRVDGFSPPPESLTRLDCRTGAGPQEFQFDATGQYYLQIGGVDGARGLLQVHLDCRGCGTVEGLETGPGAADRGGGIGLPNTGSGGYLPGARRHTD
jgi:hypothetical protein